MLKDQEALVHRLRMDKVSRSSRTTSIFLLCISLDLSFKFHLGLCEKQGDNSYSLSHVK